VSLLANVLLVGFIGGHAYKRWANHPWQSMKQDLEPETRNVVGRAFQSTFKDMKPLGDEARKQRAELLKILSAEEFDEAAFDKVAEELANTRDDMTALKIKATKDVAKVLSPEERVKMADRMVKMIGGGREHKVKRDRKPKAMDRPHPEE
jgi:Spy/CpxP family protein refolding chaperone